MTKLLRTSIKELRKIIDEFYFQLMDEVKGIYKNPKEIIKQGILIPIINKTPEQIDTWEFEKEKELKPEFIKEMRNIQRGKHFGFKDIKDLRRQTK